MGNVDSNIHEGITLFWALFSLALVVVFARTMLLASVRVFLDALEDAWHELVEQIKSSISR